MADEEKDEKTEETSEPSTEEKQDEKVSDSSTDEKPDSKKEEETTETETTETETTETETTETEETDKSTEKEHSVPFHEDPKVQDYISRQVEKRFNTLKDESSQSKETEPDKIGLAVSKLEKLGWGKDHISSVQEVIDLIVERKMAPLTAASQQQKMESRLLEFADTHSDFKDYSDKIGELYDKLSPDMKRVVRSDQDGISFLYARAKAENSFEKGKEAAYKSQKAKKKGGTIKGGATETSTGWTRAKIDNLTDKEYDKHHDEIIKALESGKIK